MKVKKEFVLRNISDEYMVIPIGEEADRVHGIIRLNETSAFLWGLLKTERTNDELVKELVNKYSIKEEVATEDVKEFIESLSLLECFE